MSLDVYLKTDHPLKIASSERRIFIRENGHMMQISRDEWDRRFPGREPVTIEADDDDPYVYHANITHNLNTMADAAGIYKHLWRPEEIGITLASELIRPLTDGLDRLRAEPDKFKQFNPPNGWGNYDGLIQFIEEYLLACKAYPSATVRVWA